MVDVVVEHCSLWCLKRVLVIFLEAKRDPFVCDCKQRAKYVVSYKSVEFFEQLNWIYSCLGYSCEIQVDKIRLTLLGWVQWNFVTNPWPTKECGIQERSSGAITFPIHNPIHQALELMPRRRTSRSRHTVIVEWPSRSRRGGGGLTGGHKACPWPASTVRHGKLGALCENQGVWVDSFRVNDDSNPKRGPLIGEKVSWSSFSEEYFWLTIRPSDQDC